MINLIEVLAKNNSNHNLYESIHINVSTIVSITPYYAVLSASGEWWRCNPNHDEAQLKTFMLKCSNGQTHYCSNEDELGKIGLSLKEQVKKTPIGFIQDKNGSDVAF